MMYESKRNVKIKDQKSKLRSPPEADDFLNFTFYTLNFNFPKASRIMRRVVRYFSEIR